MCNVPNDPVDFDRITNASQELIPQVQKTTDTWMEGVHALALALRTMVVIKMTHDGDDQKKATQYVDRVLEHYIHHVGMVGLKAMSAEDAKRIIDKLSRGEPLTAEDQGGVEAVIDGGAKEYAGDDRKRFDSELLEISLSLMNTERGKKIGLDFSESVTWVGFTADQAQRLGEAFLEAAADLRLAQSDSPSSQVH